jgi:hypothetical protein
MQWDPRDEDKSAAWELYVELITRVATQRLDPDEGEEAGALKSIYELFPLTRETIKRNGRHCINFTRIAVVVLNQKVRPFTAKWRPIVLAGALSAAQRQEFRAELSALQTDLRNYNPAARRPGGRGGPDRPGRGLSQGSRSHGHDEDSAAAPQGQQMTTLFISHSSKDKARAEALYEALRGHGYHSLFLDSHPDDGIPAGAKWEQTLWQRLRQSRGVVVLCTRHWLASPWCVAEAMIARERGKPVFLLAAADIVDGRQVKGAQQGEETPQIPDFLKDTQFISVAGLTEEEIHRRLWRGLEEEGLRDDFRLPDRPYPGLEPFQESDAAVFFGRDDEIVRVRGMLNRRRRNNAKGFILVLGASGCGKSSLVRAGVLPRLRPSAVAGLGDRDAFCG